MRRYLNVNVLLLTGVDPTNPIAAHHQVWMGNRESKENWLSDTADATGCSLVKWILPHHWEPTEGRAQKHSMTFAQLKLALRKVFALRTDSLDLELSGEELVVEHTRSLASSMAAYHDSEHFPIHPEMIFCPKDEGLLLRVPACRCSRLTRQHQR